MLLFAAMYFLMIAPQRKKQKQHEAMLKSLESGDEVVAIDDLRDAGTRTSKRRCGRLMRAVGLRGRKKHASQPRTTDSRHAQPVAPISSPNVLLPPAPISAG